jgi:hypothetical protein
LDLRYLAYQLRLDTTPWDNSSNRGAPHSGAFAVGAASHLNLVPNEQLGIVVLTNAYPLGIAEALGTIFVDTTLYGKPTQNWLAIFKRIFADPAAIGTFPGFDYSKPPGSPSPTSKNGAYLGRYTNDFFGDISIIEKDSGLAIVQGRKTRPSQ